MFDSSLQHRCHVSEGDCWASFVLKKQLIYLIRLKEPAKEITGKRLKKGWMH
jgi:hypothetical protein